MADVVFAFLDVFFFLDVFVFVFLDRTLDPLDEVVEVVAEADVVDVVVEGGAVVEVVVLVVVLVVLGVRVEDGTLISVEVRLKPVYPASSLPRTALLPASDVFLG